MVSSLDMIFLLKHWAHIDVREMQKNPRMPGGTIWLKLRNNLHAILTISDQFLPHAELKDATTNIYRDAV